MRQSAAVVLNEFVVKTCVGVNEIRDQNGAGGAFHESAEFLRDFFCRLGMESVGGKHFVGQKRGDAVQQEGTAAVRMFQAAENVGICSDFSVNC